MKLRYGSKGKDKMGLEFSVSWVRAKLIFLENINLLTGPLSYLNTFVYIIRCELQF